MDAAHKPSSVNSVRWSDADLLLWLRKLDLSNNQLTDWEIKFVGSNVDKEPDKVRFSPKQRACIYRIISKHRNIK